MEILFGNKGIYHYMDAKVGTMQELEEHGRMYQVRMLVENELPYILPSSMICTDGRYGCRTIRRIAMVYRHICSKRQ